MSSRLGTGRWALLGGVLALAGCAFGYSPEPLAGPAHEVLAPPPPSSLLVSAAHLAHPILKPIALDLSDGLSPEEAAVYAVLACPRLKTVRAQSELAAAQVIAAGILPNPTFSYTLGKANGEPGLGNPWSVALEWQVSPLVSRGARVDAAEARQAGVALDVAWQEWLVAQQAKLAVNRVDTLRRQAALARQADARLRQNLLLVRRAVKSKDMTALELAAAQTAANQRHASLLTLETDAETERLALNALLGLPPKAPLRLQVDRAPIAARRLPSLDALLDGLEDRRLDLVALRRAYEGQEAEVRASVLDRFPRITFSADHQRDETGVKFYDVGVSIDLPLFDRNQAQVAEARATRRQLRAEYQARVFAARAGLARLLAVIRGTRAQLDTARDALPSLERLVDTYRQAVARGQADVLSYYRAINDLNLKRLEILSLEQRVREARIGLELSAGLFELPEAP